MRRIKLRLEELVDDLMFYFDELLWVVTDRIKRGH